MTNKNTKSKLVRKLSEMSGTPIREITDDTMIFQNLKMDFDDVSELVVEFYSAFPIDFPVEMELSYTELDGMTLNDFLHSFAELASHRAIVDFAREETAKGKFASAMGLDADHNGEDALSDMGVLYKDEISGLQKTLNNIFVDLNLDSNAFGVGTKANDLIDFVAERIVAQPIQAKDLEIEPTFAAVASVAAETFDVGVEQIKLETVPTRDLEGVDSLDVLEFVIKLRNHFNVDFPDDVVNATDDMNGTVRWVHSMVSSSGPDVQPT